MPPGPKVSVVVGDFARRRYLAGAIRSLDAQTLPADQVERIVLTGYDDPELRARLAATGAETVVDRSPDIGAWLTAALRRARAPIVTFLNDDDEYEPDRLARVVDVFERYPDLALYRNRVSVIDADGRPQPASRWRVHETDAAFDRTGPVYVPPEDGDRAFDLAARSAHVTFNASTMAVRRDLLDGPLASVFARTNADDMFWFVAAAVSGRGLYFDDRRLTRFRFDRGSVTHEVAWLGRAERSYRDLAEVARDRGRADLDGWLAPLAVHFGRMYRGEAVVDDVVAGRGRASVARRTGEYLRFLGGHPAERAWTVETWAAAAYGLAYLGAPALAARLARARRVARART
jgi:glycosyltransferase involved in cell wall biosynthesis